MLQLFLPVLRFFGADCAMHSFLGIPPWYKYLVLAHDFTANGNACDPSSSFSLLKGSKLDLSSLSLVGLGVLDILLHVAGLVAAGYIMYAGFKYITAQGEPEATKKALDTIINACIGLGITVVAAATVAFVGARVVGP